MTACLLTAVVSSVCEADCCCCCAAVKPQIVEAIAAAVEKGLTIPIIYNTSAYDGPQSLRLMDGLVDIYMPGGVLLCVATWYRTNASICSLS